ncbi:MAG: hypothetical protein M3464_12370 [Chloroflexota bacterium]|nr:hypothetical protein [Chloroflexota bacterium]
MVTTDWELGSWDERDAEVERAEEIEMVRTAFEEEGGPSVIVHDPIEFRARTLVRIQGPGGTFWYETGGRTCPNIYDRSWVENWRTYVDAVSDWVDAEEADADLWPGTAHPCHPAWDE